MKIKISDIKVNPGRRAVESKAVAELAKSIATVGLLNPITLTEDYILIAGLHRLEAAKQLGWTEIESTVADMSGLQAELAEIDENIVRTKLTHQELGEQFLRRKELYEILHPETKAGVAQAAGMNRAVGNNVGAKLASTSKSFVEDTSQKTGMSKRAVSRLLQIANNLTEDAKRIVQANNMTQDTALKLSRLHGTQQIEAASLLADGKIQSVEQYQQEQREKILALHSSLPDTPSEDTRTEEEKERQKAESLNGLAREFTQFVDQFLGRMEMYQGFADAFAEMSPLQIGQVWDSAAAVNMAIIKFSKEVKAIQAEQEEQPH